MKNQSRIEGLLAESLKKQDQMIERQDRQQELMDILVQGQAKLLLNAEESNRLLANIEDKLTEVVI
ncbi:MAG: hypothetical protein AAF944_10640 [Bacteroidota bacterium]